jgi:PAS domain S-box-containing protein
MNFKQYIKKGSFYAAVVEDGSDMIFIVDFEGNIHYHNASVRETLGYRRKLIGKNFFEFIPPAIVNDLKKKFRQSEKRAYTEKVP